MIFEQHAAADALDVTWVRLQATLKSVKRIARMQKGNLSHADRIAMQREADDDS